MYRGIEAIEHFMESIGLVWRPGATASAELRASYRIGNTRPLGIDCTLVEFHCDAKRPKIWVPEFSRTSFHQWFEVPYQDFEFTPGGSMLKIKAAARAPVQRGPQAAGLTPARGRLQLLVHDGGAVQPVRVMRIAAEARDDAHRHIPQRGIQGLGAIAGARVQRDQAAPGSHGQRLDLCHQGPRDALAPEIRMHQQLAHLGAVRLIGRGVAIELHRAGQPAVLPGGHQQQAAPATPGSTLSRQNASASSGLYGRTKLTLAPACTLACSSSASSGSRVSVSAAESVAMRREARWSGM